MSNYPDGYKTNYETYTPKVGWWLIGIFAPLTILFVVLWFVVTESRGLMLVGAAVMAAAALWGVVIVMAGDDTDPGAAPDNTADQNGSPR